MPLQRQNFFLFTFTPPRQAQLDTREPTGVYLGASIQLKTGNCGLENLVTCRVIVETPSTFRGDGRSPCSPQRQRAKSANPSQLMSFKERDDEGSSSGA